MNRNHQFVEISGSKLDFTLIHYFGLETLETFKFSVRQSARSEIIPWNLVQLSIIRHTTTTKVSEQSHITHHITSLWQEYQKLIEKLERKHHTRKPHKRKHKKLRKNKERKPIKYQIEDVVDIILEYVH